MSLPRAPRSIFCVAVAALLTAAACEKDPFDPSTYYDKLNDPRTYDDAVRNLERLRDLKAVKPLGKAWRKWNKPSNALRAIITIAGTNDPEGAQYGIKRTPNYDDALEFLVEAVETFDPGVERSIDDATVACDALGKSRKPEAIEVLVRAATKPVAKTSPANRVRVAAILALGKFKDPRAVDTLIKILGADPETQLINLHGAAALALAETGDPKALPALTKAAFLERIYPQVRAGITRVGKQSVPAMIKMFQEQDPEIQALAKQKDFAKVAPGAVSFKAALFLGDLRARDAVPVLLAELKKPPRTIFRDPNGVDSFTTHHNGILDALRRIGDPSAAEPVYEYMIAKTTDDVAARPLAIDVYSMLSTDTKALKFLLDIVKDDGAEPNTRGAAIIAYGRLGRTSAHKADLEAVMATYEAKAKKAEAEYNAAKAKKPPDDDAMDTAERTKLDATEMANAIKESTYRIDIAITCEEKAKPEDKTPDKIALCYANSLADKDVQIGKPGLPRAERALIELGKMGEKARAAVPVLLKYLDSSERIVREGILLALPRVAALPCPSCTDRCREVIEGQAKQTTLDQLNAETRVVYHWFMWAGT